jgi:hypothetical protein
MQILLSVLLVFVASAAAAAATVAAIWRRYRRNDEANDLRRFAEEVSVAAERAATTAHRARANWLAAADEVEAAWAVFEEADARTRRFAAAAALPEPATPQTPTEYADRERYLYRAATVANRRGELPVQQLTDVLANRNGWDPRRHPVQQELALSRAHRDAALAAYQNSSARERSAWRDCESAAVAAQSLRIEADAARQAVPGVAWESTESTQTVATPVMAPAAPLRAVRAS